MPRKNALFTKKGGVDFFTTLKFLAKIGPTGFLLPLLEETHDRILFNRYFRKI